jgi:hypothetical protein
MDEAREKMRDVEPLHARIAELEAALKPFADAWDEKETWQWQINIDDLRAARAALNGEK